MQDEFSGELLSQWRRGDQAAATEIFNEYLERLIALARSRLSAKMRRRIDPEDVVQSAYQSFFRRARNDEFVLERSGDLWRLLAAITINKLRGQVEFHRAEKRTIDQDESWGGKVRPVDLPPAVARDPSPEEGSAVVEELENVVRGLQPLYRQIFEARIQGVSITEIAAETQRSERTVRRALETIRDQLEQRLLGTLDK